MGERSAPGPSVLLVVHGTRREAGARVAETLRCALTRRTGRAVHLAHADVRAPDVAGALARLPGPVTLVPAFLASGYHVRTDIPAQIERAGRTDVHVTPPLGPAPALLPALVDRLAESGARTFGYGDALVLAGAGSSDPGARAEVEGMAGRLGRLLSCPVSVGWAATSAPSVADTVARLRAEGARHIAVATWLLAPGLFADRLHTAGADTVAAPLAAHPAVVALLAERATDGPPASGSAPAPKRGAVPAPVSAAAVSPAPVREPASVPVPAPMPMPMPTAVGERRTARA
ncbi:sirohydrochlorin chelatase [Streptomyces iconiensis]|uniref:Sirohydrochlorin chelatase n=1 Tax=Streptomyces iconiensis TaxID=1384038 RepID=A0ABT7A5B2_9ACTN|nr:sirohydrochlorin chelatase [Streptomyces iconiensis]MDJ1136515.1 sirohydrochlorin chelatase [Streptomyces iconiensis]